MTTAISTHNNAQNTLHTFTLNFPVDGEAANLLHYYRLVTDLLHTLERGDKRGKEQNGFGVASARER